MRLISTLLIFFLASMANAVPSKNDLITSAFAKRVARDYGNCIKQSDDCVIPDNTYDLMHDVPNDRQRMRLLRLHNHFVKKYNINYDSWDSFYHACGQVISNGEVVDCLFGVYGFPFLKKIKETLPEGSRLCQREYAKRAGLWLRDSIKRPDRDASERHTAAVERRCGPGVGLGPMGLYVGSTALELRNFSEKPKNNAFSLDFPNHCDKVWYEWGTIVRDAHGITGQELFDVCTFPCTVESCSPSLTCEELCTGNFQS